MNKYSRGPTIGGPSKANASTRCQKCLKLGHYSYECKAIAQERPYVSRPSRTQQLLNPKLMPKLTDEAPQDLLRKKGIADEQLARAEVERGRKRERQSEGPDGAPSKRLRSASSSSSVSTISTSISRSPSPSRSPSRSQSPALRRTTNELRHGSRSNSPIQSGAKAPSPFSSRSPPHSIMRTDSEKKRRRGSISSADSHSSDLGRDRPSSRSTRRRFLRQSPSIRGRRTESSSPHPTTRLPDDRPRLKRDTHHRTSDREEKVSRIRERSLSPFSKRLAMTQAMNTSR